MKQHHSIFLLSAASLACTLILMLAACTPDALDELPSAGTDSDAHPLTISVSDGGMYATAPRNTATKPSSPKATASASTW